MSWRDSIPFLGQSKSKTTIAVAPYGGGIRPAIVPPSVIVARLNRLAMLRTILTSFIAFVVIACLVIVFLLVQRMDTRLYVADGTAFGCEVREIGGGEQ